MLISVVVFLLVFLKLLSPIVSICVYNRITGDLFDKAYNKVALS